MKKLIILVFITIGYTASAQVQKFKNLNITGNLKLGDTTVSGISKDSTSTYGSNDDLITSGAAKAYARTLAATGVAGDSGIVVAAGIAKITGRLNTVSQFSTYDKATSIIEVADTLRGGKFNLYAGSDAADNGMIFADALGRKWLREVKDDKINVLWYGAKGDGGPTDNIVPFEAAREYMRSHLQYKTLKIPFYSNPVAYNRYYLSRTFVINLPIDLKGESVGTWEATRLYFPANTTGLLFQPFNYDFHCGLENINIENAYIARSLIDSSKSLIVVHSTINAKNVKVLYATGNCFEISSESGGDSTTNPIFGNAGFSSLQNVRLHEGLNGLYITGAESNSMHIENCVFQSNVRWGVLDDGLLGNTYYTGNFQGNSNNSLSGAATTVTYGGEYYAAMPAHDDGSGIGKRPDQHEWTYWLKTGPRAAAAWDTTKHYWSGGSYYVKNANATTKFYQPYVEGDNGPYYLNARSESDGGIDGVGYGIGHRTFTSVGGHIINGTVTVNNNPNPNTRNGFGVGIQPDAGTITHFKNKSGYNTISLFEGYNTSSFNTFKNTSGSFSSGYLSNQFRAYNSPSNKYFYADSSKIGFSSGSSWNYGTGSPEGAVTATVGSFYSRTDGGTGTSIYFKESGSGNTGWVAAAFGSVPTLWQVISSGDVMAGAVDIDAAGYDFRVNDGGELGFSGDSITFSANAGANHFHIKGDSTVVDKRISYNSNINSSFTQHSLVDKNYVDSSITAGSGVKTMAAIGASPNANGASISATTLTLQPASASFGGVVTTGTQTLAGDKTMTGAFTVSSSAQTPASVTSSFAGNMQVNFNSSTSNNVNWVLQKGGVTKWYFGNNATVDKLHILNGSAGVAMSILQDLKVGINQTTPTSVLDVNGSFSTAYTATATSITAAATHQVIDVTATGQTITLPAAAGITGRIYTIKLTAAGSATVDGNASETIDGATTYSLASQYKYVTIQSTGSAWIVIANN